MSDVVYEACVVGLGAVGCAVARQVCLGHSCIAIEKNLDPLDEASGGNTGHLATNFYFDEGRQCPMETELTQVAAASNPAWLAEQPNVPRRRCGLLYVALSAEEMATLGEMAAKAQVAGVRLVDKQEVAALEPGIDMSGVCGGLISEEEFVVDSFLLALSNLYSALKKGCHMVTGCKMEGAERVDGIWHIATSLVGGEKKVWKARKLLNCGGNYSDQIHSLMFKTSPFNIRPARGSFVAIRNDQDDKIRHMVVMAPSKVTAGPYIFTSAYGNALVVGPTHREQSSKTDRVATEDETRKLISHGKTLFPKVFEENGVRTSTFVGLRPSCQHRDYQIFVDKTREVATVGAIRSTGLTASRAIAQYVAEELWGSSTEPAEPADAVVMPKPQVSRPGHIMVGEYEFKVTHPLSKLGIFGF